MKMATSLRIVLKALPFFYLLFYESKVRHECKITPVLKAFSNHEVDSEELDL
jgi:hypothetical protein